MIVYKATKEVFIKDVLGNSIESKIVDQFEKKFGKANLSEVRSWRNSMMYMSNIMIQTSVPDDGMIAIEYQVPNTSKRIDFIISGQNEDEEDSIIIVELKQWEKAKKTHKDGIVISYVAKKERELVHPSHQAMTYARLIKDYNEVVQKDNIHIYPCSYLHNYKRNGNTDPILDSWYDEYLNEAPSFLNDDTDKLVDFIDKFIKYGDRTDILYRIDNGRIRPSKSLADSVASMLKGNKEFYMIEDQKVSYEFIMDAILNNPNKEKRTIIVEGGPGTGKSVIAINLLVQMLNNTKNAQYITRNSAPREVYSKLLKGHFRRNFIDNLFKGSGSFVGLEDNYFDVLIVDEAHRLIKKSRYDKNAEDQTKEIIQSSLVNIFFIDEDQMVTLDDVGSIEKIKMYAEEFDSEIYMMELVSQFRCNGSDGYLAWLNDLLGIKETSNKVLDTNDFDFQIIDDPNELKQIIIEKNRIRNKARILAGYCWEWPKREKDNPLYYDISIPEYNFKMSWNLLSDGQAYLIQEESVNEAGCIHTSQGLELDYVGVIIGKDIRFENGEVITDVSKRASTDKSVFGWKKIYNENNSEGIEKIDRIIRNTYKTLLTRGVKGCYVFIQDEALRNHVKGRII